MFLFGITVNIISGEFASQNAIACGEYSNCTKCFLNPMDFAGRIKVSLGKVTMKQLEVKYNYLQPGGHHVPAGCQALNRVAVIVPYRDRESHLRILLNNMHAFLTKQKLDYAIIIVEQVNNQTFNRAKLLNAGYVEARKLYNWECYVFHDVDLLPEDDRNLHTCPTKNPRHLAVAMNKFNYQLIYEGMFGTSSIFTTDQFERSNGFSNRYWGWGGEDDDMYKRVIMAGYKVDRYDAKFARYTMIRHGREKNNPDNPSVGFFNNRNGDLQKSLYLLIFQCFHRSPLPILVIITSVNREIRHV
ncbi:N-acetyllactosaminide 3-alpha-galactosyltransferase [Cooperia oncophora]